MTEIYARYQARLLSLAEPGYRDFTVALMPGTENVLGVRLPILRELAKELARDDWRAYFMQNMDRYFEETMLQGLTIGCLCEDIETVLAETARFVPKITNWSLCDSFCSGLKITKKCRQRIWDFLKNYVNSNRPYSIRFAVVMYLWYFIDEEHTPEILQVFETIHCEDYYVKMAVAWAISMCYVNYPGLVLPFLLENRLDDVTHNKALQKICESRRPGAAEKAHVKTLRRSARVQQE